MLNLFVVKHLFVHLRTFRSLSERQPALAGDLPIVRLHRLTAYQRDLVWWRTFLLLDCSEQKGVAFLLEQFVAEPITFISEVLS